MVKAIVQYRDTNEHFDLFWYNCNHALQHEIRRGCSRSCFGLSEVTDSYHVIMSPSGLRLAGSDLREKSYLLASRKYQGSCWPPYLAPGISKGG